MGTGKALKNVVESMTRKILSLFFLLVIFTCTLSQQRDKPCSRGFECVKRDECDHYNAGIKRSKEVTKRSKEWNDIIQPLKSLICNQKDRKLCCKIKSNNPDSPGYLPGDGECGVTGDAAFIVGGKDTKLGEFPWSALIRKKGGSQKRWQCGGTLINKWYVVSAAHCIDDDEDLEEVRLGEWKVKDVDKFDHRFCTYFYESQKQDCESDRRCGKSKRRGNKYDCTYKNPNVDCDDCPELQDIEVASFQKHPNYRLNQDSVAINDIMMIKLSRPAVYNKLVKPVCLPSPTFDNLLGEESHTPGYFKDRSVVVGWGKTYRGDYKETEQTASSIQQKLATPLLSNGECIDLFKSKFGGVVLDISVEEHLCAGGERGKDSCNGDSGGPLVGREDAAGPLTLIGVVSGGARRCGQGTPAIYTRVSRYRDWILNQMV